MSKNVVYMILLAKNVAYGSYSLDSYRIKDSMLNIFPYLKQFKAESIETLCLWNMTIKNVYI